MSSEIIATFEFDRVTDRDGAAAVADLIARYLDDVGIECGDRRPIGSGLRLVASVGRRRVPVFVGPWPSDPPEPQRWFVSIGASLTPLARLIGGKDDDARARVTGVISAALPAEPGIGALRWNVDDSDT